MLFLAALCAPVQAADRTASIYYFDHQYHLSYELSQAAEDIITSTSTMKLQRAATSITYTNGAKFLIDGPEDLTEEDLERTTDYSVIGPVEIIEGGNSFLLPPQEMLDVFAPPLQEAVRAYFTVERQPAALLEGRAPSGVKFVVLYLSQRQERPLWEPTVKMQHVVAYEGREKVFTGVSIPMGLDGLNRKMVEEASHKGSAALLSIGAGGKLAEASFANGPGQLIDRMDAAGTDITALSPSDLRNFWQWQNGGGLHLSTAAPEFICTNVKVNDPELAKIIKPYALRQIGGITVAFIALVPSNSAVATDMRGAPFEIADPKNDKALYSVINELRGEKGARLVVAVSFLDRDELGWLMGARGIDALIGPKTWDNESLRHTRVDLRRWEVEAHTGPALTVFPDSRGAGMIKVELGPRGALTALESAPPPDDAREPLFYREQVKLKYRILAQLMGNGETLLPDLRELGSAAMYGIPDFFNLSASLLRKAYGAEIAAVKVRPFTSSVLGDIPTAMVRSWLGTDEPVELALVPGAFVQELIDKKVPARNPDSYLLQDYYGREYYAVSGLDASGKVAGMPVSPSETYLAALPASLLAGRDFEKVRKPAGSPATLHDAVIGGLKAMKAADGGRTEWENRVWAESKNVPPPRDIWRVDLRNLSLKVLNTSIHGPSGYASTSESKLSSDPQTLIQGSGKLYADYYSGRFKLESGVSADYGKTTLRPRGEPTTTSESADELLYETSLVYRMKDYNGRLGSMVAGPYASAAYDTEFSRAAGARLKRVLRGSGGWKLYEGAVLQELYAGLATEQVMTYSPAHTQYALESGFRLSKPIPHTALTLDADGTYRAFARSRYDTVYDLRDRLELNLKVSTKLYGDIKISPYISYFMATGKKLSGSAYNVATGFSLEYSRLFKVRR